MSRVSLPSSILACRNLSGAEWKSSSGNEAYTVLSPYTNTVLTQFRGTSVQEIDEIVTRAHAAFLHWRSTPIKERTTILLRFRELLLQNLERLGNCAAIESGKTIAEGKAGILKGVEVAEFAASLQNSDCGGALEVSRGVTCSYRREPLGVVVGISPFNFPAMVPLWMYPIAITLGNCFVLKPSEKVPLTSQIVGELMLQSGFPPGVFSIANGGRATVEALIQHPLVKAVGFVGSSPAAMSVYRLATNLGKRALCLGGAKNCLILAPDANPTVATQGVVSSFTGCAGQRCMAASLLLAVGDVSQLIDEIRASAARIQIGAEMGAIISKESRERLVREIEQASRDGAQIILDGRMAKPPAGFENGNWLGPTIIDHATMNMRCATEELFGPIITIVRVSDLTQAMAIEAALPYGNASSVFTQSGAVARFVSEHSTCGMIGINVGVPVPREPFSFGGTKASKYGCADITGASSVEFWSDRKKITTKWEMQTDSSWMS